MYYLIARYYDPKVGRFNSLDKQLGSIASPQDMNRYVYCRNNPIMYIDPTGEEATVIVGGVVVILSSPAGQQLLAEAQALGLTVLNYVNLYGAQAVQIVGNYGAAAAEQVGQALKWASDKVGEGANKAKDWFNNQFNSNKPSLTKVNNSTANQFSKKHGFKDAHDFK